MTRRHTSLSYSVPTRLRDAAMDVIVGVRWAGLDLYLWLTYRTFGLKRPLRLTWPLLYRQFGIDPSRMSSRLWVRTASEHTQARIKRGRLPKGSLLPPLAVM